MVGSSRRSRVQTSAGSNSRPKPLANGRWVRNTYIYSRRGGGQPASEGGESLRLSMHALGAVWHGLPLFVRRETAFRGKARDKNAPAATLGTTGVAEPGDGCPSLTSDTSHQDQYRCKCAAFGHRSTSIVAPNPVCRKKQAENCFLLSCQGCHQYET